ANARGDTECAPRGRAPAARAGCADTYAPGLGSGALRDRAHHSDRARAPPGTERRRRAHRADRAPRCARRRKPPPRSVPRARFGALVRTARECSSPRRVSPRSVGPRSVTRCQKEPCAVSVEATRRRAQAKTEARRRASWLSRSHPERSETSGTRECTECPVVSRNIQFLVLESRRLRSATRVWAAALGGALRGTVLSLYSGLLGP